MNNVGYEYLSARKIPAASSLQDLVLSTIISAGFLLCKKVTEPARKWEAETDPKIKTENFIILGIKIALWQMVPTRLSRMWRFRAYNWTRDTTWDIAAKRKWDHEFFRKFYYEQFLSVLRF